MQTKQKKKKKKQIETKINNFRNNIVKYNDSIWCPNAGIEYESKNINSWFDINVSESINKHKFKYKFNKKHNGNDFMKCKRIELKLNIPQKKIVNHWFNSYTIMYNKTLKLIKKRSLSKETNTLNFRKLRTNYLKDEKKDIENFYKEKKLKVQSHSLDYAIKTASTSYKSAFANLRNKNIKHFRVRYLKINRPRKIFDFESQNFGKKGLCFNALRKVNAYYDNNIYDLSKVSTTSRLVYDKMVNRYYLYVPEKVEQEKLEQPNEVISLDPGIRTFMTGISENEAIKIGDKCNGRIKEYLQKTDKINRKEISNKIKRKHEKRNNKKISNLVDELHWKSINYLTNNYKNILIGNLSTKGIVSNNASNLYKMTKRLAYRFKFHVFRQRLEYKCNVKNANYILIDESYTSKMCSRCGYCKNDLGAAKIFECDDCDVRMDRDINGARGILIKGMKK